jgi:hypothetical protein
LRFSSDLHYKSFCRLNPLFWLRGNWSSMWPRLGSSCPFWACRCTCMEIQK